VPNGRFERTGHKRREKARAARALPMYLLSIPGMRESIRAAMAEPLTKSATGLQW
jgi:hypothetical protein